MGVAEQRGSSQAGVANLYVPLADTQDLVGLQADQVNQVYVRVADASHTDAVVEALTPPAYHRADRLSTRAAVALPSAVA